MSKLYYGSICLTDLMKLAKEANKAFSRAQNGKVYCNVNVWINDEADKYGNVASIQTTFKDAAKEDRVYFGNLKESTPQTTPLQANENEFSDEEEMDGLPF